MNQQVVAASNTVPRLRAEHDRLGRRAELIGRAPLAAERDLGPKEVRS